jgi:hypothetical protein
VCFSWHVDVGTLDEVEKAIEAVDKHEDHIKALSVSWREADEQESEDTGD